ncbi:MAG TPA: hypothetical protein VF659_10120 [Pyrinomonadaceae bacterium]|jgi:hypothetical protein
MLTITLRPSLTLALAAALTLAGLSRPRAAEAQATTTTTNVTNQINATFFSPCAGEVITVTGDIHTLFHFTSNGNHTTVKTHSQPQGVIAVGQTTGDVYHGTGVSQSTSTFQSDGATTEFTVIVNVGFVGPGPGNNMLVHNVLHNTFNNNGELTSSQSNFNADCK